VPEDLTESIPGEVDLRGLDREACLRRLELFLDRAQLGYLTRVRIVHGKGTGALRRAVHDYLERHPQVRSHREGEAAEGGWGVTIAFLDSPYGTGASGER